MSTIQEQMLMYHAIEDVLRVAATQQHPLALRDIWEKAEVRGAISKETMVRDKINVLVKRGLVTKVTIAQGESGDKRSRVGYMWADMDRHADDELDYKHAAAGAQGAYKRHLAVPHVNEPTDDVEIEVNGMIVYAGKGVELHINNVVCVVDKNPDSNRVRLYIK